MAIGGGISSNILANGCCLPTTLDHVLPLLSNGELYTFVTNLDVCTRERSLVAVVAGTKSEDVIAVLRKIDEEKRLTVREVTLDLSDSIRKIIRTAFPKVDRAIDRFHIRKLACDAVQELIIRHR